MVTQSSMISFLRDQKAEIAKDPSKTSSLLERIADHKANKTQNKYVKIAAAVAVIAVVVLAAVGTLAALFTNPVSAVLGVAALLGTAALLYKAIHRNPSDNNEFRSIQNEISTEKRSKLSDFIQTVKSAVTGKNINEDTVRLIETGEIDNYKNAR